MNKKVAFLGLMAVGVSTILAGCGTGTQKTDKTVKGGEKAPEIIREIKEIPTDWKVENLQTKKQMPNEQMSEKQANEDEKTPMTDEEKARLEAEDKITSSFKGLTLKEAEEKAKKENFVLRVASVDGEGKDLTADLMLNRVNVDVRDWKVVDAFMG